MLAIFQFPIADLRPFSTECPQVLLPPLPPASLYDAVCADNFRYFGWAAMRAKGTDQAFNDESHYYSAHNALYLDKLGQKIFRKAGIEVKPKVGAKRRFFITKGGIPPVRLEIGIGVTADQSPLEFDILIKLLTTVLCLPSKVLPIKTLPADLHLQPRIDLNMAGPLVCHGKAMAYHYALATAEWDSDICKKLTDMVRVCQPVMVVQFDPSEVKLSDIEGKLPVFKKLGREQTGGADVWYGMITSGHRNRIPCWLIGPGQTTKGDTRKLRLCLLRLHAEHRALEEVLRWLERDKEPKLDAQKLENYLSTVWRTVLDRENRAHIDQSTLMSAIASLAAVRPEAQSIDLKNRVIEIRRNLNLKPFKREKQVEQPPGWKDWLKNVKPQPDLAIAIHNPGGSSELQWSFYSPHITISGEQEHTYIGNEPERFHDYLLDAASNEGILQNQLSGLGIGLGEHVPQTLWNHIENLTKTLKRKPTVLLLSEDPCLPWEIAINPDNKESGFLGANAIIGRWLLQTLDTRPIYPPCQLSIDSGILVMADNLSAAQKEVKSIEKELSKNSSGQTFKRLKANEVSDYLAKKPDEHLLHFAVHGRYSPNSPEGGLDLGGKTLTFIEVKGVDLKGKPFVFLNACEVGIGNRMLGKIEGMAEAFINAGASAVVVPNWAINDAKAKDIAIAFYTKAFSKEAPSVADFFHQHFVEYDGTDLTSVAYKFYGHPELRLTLAAKGVG